MLAHSQPIDPKFYKKLNLSDPDEPGERPVPVITSQRIGKMFDDILEDKRKIDLATRLKWKRISVQNKYYDIKHTIQNHFRWHKTMKTLRSWNGYDGLLLVMQTHLQGYIESEEKYGVSLEEYKQYKITTAKETLVILERMCEPNEYLFKRRKEIDARYPKYSSLISEYKDGGTCFSGDFIPQGHGFAGKESGKDPREGYFEFVDGRFESMKSPDEAETNRILSELARYHDEILEAYTQAEADSDQDFERLGQLLKENLYTWWD